MSFGTQTPQQLYEAERVRAATLGRKNLQLQAEIDRLETVVTESQFGLQAKDETIQELQTALDNKDRPSASGDVKELQAKFKHLEAKHEDFIDRATKRIERDAKRREESHQRDARNRAELASAKAELEKSLAESTSTKAQLDKSQAELEEFRGLKTSLPEVHFLLGEVGKNVRVQYERIGSIVEHWERPTSSIGSMGSRLRQHKSENRDSLTKLDPAPLATRRRVDPQPPSPIFVAKDFDIESFESHNTRLPASEDKKGQGVPPPKFLLQAARKGKVAEEGTDEPRATNDEDFSAAAKDLSASVMRDSIQDCSAEHSASHAPRVPKSSAELEQLRLKDRKTLHRLDLV